MHDDRLRELFHDHAPTAATPAESAAALAAGRPRFVRGLERRRIAMTAASLGVVLCAGVGTLVLLGNDTEPAEYAVPPSTTTTLPATAELFVTPGGSVEATVDDGMLTLVGSMAADGYVAMVDVMTAARLQVSFRGPQTHVVVLEVDDRGEIVEVDDLPDESSPPAGNPEPIDPPAPPATNPPADAPSSAPTTTVTAEPSASPSPAPSPEPTPPDPTPPTETTRPEPDDDRDEGDDGPGWDWGWNPGKGWDWDWNPGTGWDWNSGGDDGEDDDQGDDEDD